MSSLFGWYSHKLSIFLKSDFLFPIILFIVYVLLFLFIRKHLPTGDHLIELFNGLYAQYGYQILLLSAFLESLFIINFFVPGQISLVLGIIFAKTSRMELIPVILVICLGAILGYLIDFALGYFGLSKILEKHGFKKALVESEESVSEISNTKLVLGFIHCNLGALLSFGAGSLKINFLRFMSFAVIFTILFTSLWSVLIYTFSDFFVEIIRKYVYFLVLIVGGYTLFNNFLKDKKLKETNETKETEETKVLKH